MPLSREKIMLPFRQLIYQNVQSFGRQTYINKFLPNDFHFVIQKRIVLPTERHRGQEIPEIEDSRLEGKRHPRWKS